MGTNSPRHKWQTRWSVDIAYGTAKHDCGLFVQFFSGEAIPQNADEIIAKLAPKHGHNATAMVARMVKEAGALMRAALSGEPARL